MALGHSGNRNWTQKNAPSGQRDQIDLILKYVVDNVFNDSMCKCEKNLQIGLGFAAAR